MATGTMKWFRQGLVAMLRGDIDYENDTIKVMLIGPATTIPSGGDASFTYAAAESKQVTTVQQTLSGKSIATGAGCVARLIADDPTWTSLTTSAAVSCVIVYDDTHASDLPIMYANLSEAVSVTNGTLSLDFDGTNGFITLDGA